VLTGSDDWSAKLFDKASGKCLSTFPGVKELTALNMNREEVVLGYADGTIRVFNKLNGEFKYMFAEHKHKISKIILTNKEILSISEDCTAKLIRNRYSYESMPDLHSLISD